MKRLIVACSLLLAGHTYAQTTTQKVDELLSAFADLKEFQGTA